MSPTLFNIPLHALVLAVLIAVAFFNASINVVQDSISNMRLYQSSSLSSKVMVYLCATVPYLWLAIALFILTTACAYLTHELYQLKHSAKKRQSELSTTVLQAYGVLNQRDDYRRRYEDAAHANFNTQKHVAAMKCSHGKRFVSIESFGTHTCCDDAGKLRRKVILLETQLQNECRFRKAPVDVDTISAIAMDMAQGPERWWPVLDKLLPSLMARTRAVPGEHQSQKASLQATIQRLSAQVEIQAVATGKLHMTTQEDAKKASDLQCGYETLQNLNNENIDTIRSLRLELENKVAFVKELEDNKVAAQATKESQEADVRDTRVTNANCTHCAESAGTLTEFKAAVHAKSEQIQILTRENKTLSSLVSRKADTEANSTDLERQLQRSKAEVVELEKERCDLTEKLRNQHNEFQERTANQSEEIDRLKKDKLDLERRSMSRTVRFASPETLPQPESASTETTLGQQAAEKDTQIALLRQTVNEYQTAQRSANDEFGQYKAMVTQAEQVARMALGLEDATPSILELVQNFEARLKQAKDEFAPLAEIAAIETGVGNAIRNKFLQLNEDCEQLVKEKYTVQFELQQEINEKDSEIRQLKAEAETTNSDGPELANAQSRIAELERQKNEATAARQRSIGLEVQMRAQIEHQTREIAVCKEAEQESQRNLIEQGALIAKLNSGNDLVKIFVDQHKIGFASEPFALRLGRLEEEYKRFHALNGDALRELKKAWEILAMCHLTWKDKEHNEFETVFECVSFLVACVGGVHTEVNRIFSSDKHYDPEVDNIANRVRQLREDRDQAVRCLLDEREKLKAKREQVRHLRQRISEQGDTQSLGQTASNVQESTELEMEPATMPQGQQSIESSTQPAPTTQGQQLIESPTQVAIVPQGQQAGRKRRAEEDDEMASGSTELWNRSGGKQARRTYGDQDDQEDQ